MKKYLKKPYILRYLFIGMSLFINGLNITLAKISCLGTDPFSSFNYAWGSSASIPMGTAMMIVNAVMLLFCLLFLRSAIGYGMVACTVILGNASDFWNRIIVQMLGQEISFSGWDHIPLRMLILVVSVVMNVFWCSFYIGGDLGMSPYDAMGYIIEKLTKKRIRFKYARIMTDVICVAVAYLLTSPFGTQWQIIGIGTIIMAIGTGPILDFFLEHASKPFYKRICGPKEA